MILTILSLACAIGIQSPQPLVQRPRKMDEEILETVLLHFLHDRSDAVRRFGNGEKYVVLHHRNPLTLDLLPSTGKDPYLRRHKLPEEFLKGLRARNGGAQFVPLPGTGPYLWKDLLMDQRIRVLDAAAFMGPRHWAAAATGNDDIAAAKGWMECYAPAIFPDRGKAVVRARVGPTADEAVATYVLHQKANRWVVVWREVVLFKPRPKQVEQWVNIGVISPQDMSKVEQVLLRNGIRCTGEGGTLWGVQVTPPSDAERARRIVQEDARLRGYDFTGSTLRQHRSPGGR